MSITTRAAVEPLRSDPAKLRAIRTATLVDQGMVETRSWLKWTVLDIRRHFLKYYWMRPPLWRVLLRTLWDRNRMLPSFVSLGPVRSGTTLLSDYIMQHPCVVLPLAKEIGPVGLRVHRDIKRALDPENLFNPGSMFSL